MLRKLKTWHWVAIGIVVYLLWRWYSNRNNKMVEVSAKEVSKTTLDPGTEGGENTDPVVAKQVTKVIAPDNY